MSALKDFNKAIMAAKAVKKMTVIKHVIGGHVIELGVFRHRQQKEGYFIANIKIDGQPSTQSKIRGVLRAAEGES